jgi:hypothetical protein
VKVQKKEMSQAIHSEEKHVTLSVIADEQFDSTGLSLTV